MEFAASLPVRAENAEANAVLADALWRTGKTAAARARFDAVLVFDPGNATALRGRSELELRTGNSATAIVDALSGTEPPLPAVAVPQAEDGGEGLRLLRRVGRVDPTSLDSYRSLGGYTALRRANATGDLGINLQTASRRKQDAGLGWLIRKCQRHGHGVNVAGVLEVLFLP